MQHTCSRSPSVTPSLSLPGCSALSGTRPKSHPDEQFAMEGHRKREPAREGAGKGRPIRSVQQQRLHGKPSHPAHEAGPPTDSGESPMCSRGAHLGPPLRPSSVVRRPSSAPHLAAGVSGWRSASSECARTTTSVGGQTPPQRGGGSFGVRSDKATKGRQRGGAAWCLRVSALRVAAIRCSRSATLSPMRDQDQEERETSRANTGMCMDVQGTPSKAPSVATALAHLLPAPVDEPQCR